MNLKKQWLLSLFCLACLIITGCTNQQPLKTPIERALDYNAKADALGVKLTYGYGSGENERYFETTYAFYNDDKFQTGTMDDNEILYYNYVHKNKPYRVYEHNDQYFYEEAFIYFTGDWHLNPVFEKIRLDKELTYDEITSTYHTTISGTEMMTNYSALDTLVIEMTGDSRYEDIQGLDETFVDIYLAMDIETERITTMRIECEDYLKAVNPFGKFENNTITLDFSYDLEKYPDVAFGDMIADDAARWPMLKSHIVTVEEVCHTEIQYPEDSDMIKLTLTEFANIKIESTGIDVRYYYYQQYADDVFMNEVNMILGIYYGFTASTIYIRIDSTGQVGEAEFKLIVES